MRPGHSVVNMEKEESCMGGEERRLSSIQILHVDDDHNLPRRRPSTTPQSVLQESVAWGCCETEIDETTP